MPSRSSFSPVARPCFFLALVAFGLPLWAQAAPGTAATVILRVQLDSPAKVKQGTPVHAHTVGSLYNSNQLILPAGTIVNGKVIDVSPADRSKRVSAISHGDFTPLKEARIQFDSLRLANGSEFPITTEPAQQSNDVVRFQSATARHPSLFRRIWATVTNQKDQAVNTIKAPGKGDRLKKFVFAQLPWHPQAIDAGTQYDVTLLHPLVTPAAIAGNTLDLSKKKESDQLNEPALLHARLQENLSSKTAKEDDAVVASVTEPLLDKQGQIEIPQGALLRGRVLRARAAKKWGRNGALRFTFNQVDFPQGSQQQVSGVPAAVDGSRNQGLKLDAEGGVEPAKKSVVTPLALGLLATSAFLDEDASITHSAAASNGFGLVTRIVSISTGSKTVAGVIGAIATGRAVYMRYIAHGRDVVFARNSQVEVEVGPIHKLWVPAEPPSH